MIEVCVFKSEKNRTSYLLLHRAKTENIYPNIWQFITSSIKENEKATDAALRELKEETGLIPQSFWVVPHVMSFYYPDKDSMNLVPFVAVQVNENEKVKLSKEHDAFDWFQYDEALEKLVWHEQRKGLQIVQDFIVKGSEAANLSKILL